MNLNHHGPLIRIFITPKSQTRTSKTFPAERGNTIDTPIENVVDLFKLTGYVFLGYNDRLAQLPRRTDSREQKFPRRGAVGGIGHFGEFHVSGRAEAIAVIEQWDVGPGFSVGAVEVGHARRAHWEGRAGFVAEQGKGW